MFHYYQTTPPEYDLSKIRTKVDLYVGAHDWLTTVPAVLRIKDQLTTREPDYTEISHYNHVDYIWAMDARSVIYNEIINKL